MSQLLGQISGVPHLLPQGKGARSRTCTQLATLLPGGRWSCSKCGQEGEIDRAATRTSARLVAEAAAAGVAAAQEKLRDAQRRLAELDDATPRAKITVTDDDRALVQAARHYLESVDGPLAALDESRVAAFVAGWKAARAAGSS